MAGADGPLARRLTWYKDAVLYEVHVRAFADSNDDGIGDFRGLTGKLSYLQDLGVTAIWLLPFYPSPLKDDGYDIADYTDVHPGYGTLEDFEVFLAEAHRRGLRVITELVINHTSDMHPWFQRARRAPPGSPERELYVWSDSPEKYADARIIFKDFETSNWTWDPVARAYYWHRFYSHQPDLNFDNPAVHDAVFSVLDFWLAKGVDGLRLDAVPYLYEREGTNCENLPETHVFLRELRARVEARYPGRMLLAEANQWPEDAIAYFGQGDECQMCFHFPVMPRLFMAIRMEDRFPIVDIMEQTPPIPDNCQWALFLRNHDELTLEMVTDEERDFMYRVYANEPQMRINLGIRRRLAPLLGNDRRRIELMNGLLMSLPGAPVLYYGDEIGMGDNVFLGDRNGVRTPMQWTADRNAGFSRVNPQRLYLPMVMDAEYHYESLNVEAQQNNAHSLLWWTRRLLALRRRHAAFSRGTIEFLAPENRKVLAFLRQHEGQTILVVANLSRYVQAAVLDLVDFRGARPVELFGRTRLPDVGDGPYVVTLGPHAFYWFELQPAEAAIEAAERGAAPEIEMPEGEWTALLAAPAAERLEAVLPAFLVAARWFGGKARTILSARIRTAVPLAGLSDRTLAIVLVDLAYADGEPDTYLLPLAYATGEEAARLVADAPQMVVARAGGGVIHDAAADRDLALALLKIIAGSRRIPLPDDPSVQVVGRREGTLGDLQADDELPEPTLVRAEQSNTSVAFDQRFMLKLVRRIEPGINPELELGRFLDRAGFRNTPPIEGAIELEQRRQEPWTLAILEGYVTNQGDAWRFTRDALQRYFERVQTRLREHDLEEFAPPPGDLVASATVPLPPAAHEILGTYTEPAILLGRRTAEMHRALASGTDDPVFAPEPFSLLYQRSLYQSLRTLAGRIFGLLRRNVGALPEDVRERARAMAASEPDILARLRGLLEHKLVATRHRIHGDFHLGQVLYTGGDFVVIDFEGEPARTLGERRIKRSPLVDVAGMLRSFAYAAEVGVRDLRVQDTAGATDRHRLIAAGRIWQAWASRAFLGSYLEHAALAPTPEVEVLLRTFQLEKAIYELGYELNNRPDWVPIPLAGLEQLLAAENR